MPKTKTHIWQHLGTWGCGDVISTPRGSVVHIKIRSLHRFGGTSADASATSLRPHVPGRFFPDHIHSVPSTQYLHLCPFCRRHDIHAMALVRMNVEPLPQNAADPPVRDRPIVF